MSDSDSTDCSEFSICEEMEELITQLTDIHEHHHNAIITLEKIRADTSKNIYITRDDEKCNLDDILEELHSEALERIRRGENGNFGNALLCIISDAFNSK